jgi:chemotaxis-related protein WspD
MNDCWNTVGVRGDGSCPELRRHVHCHNCPVHADAAVELLDRDLPAGYSEQWASHYAASAKSADAETSPYVIVRIGSEWLGVPSHVVTEIAAIRPIHVLPHRRHSAVLGLANVRGELVICLSIARVLGIDDIASADRGDAATTLPRLLVMRDAVMRTVCPVDEVDGIHRFASSRLRELPATVARANVSYSTAVATWRDRTVGLLDEHRLFRSLQRSLT